MLLQSETETSIATIRDGITIPDAAHGDIGGLPILLLHGYADSWRSFEEILPKLPAFVQSDRRLATGAW